MTFGNAGLGVTQYVGRYRGNDAHRDGRIGEIEYSERPSPIGNVDEVDHGTDPGAVQHIAKRSTNDQSKTNRQQPNSPQARTDKPTSGQRWASSTNWRKLKEIPLL
jgi:hypothetical protein